MGKRIGWVLMTLGATFAILVSVEYFSLNPEVYFQPEVYLAHEVALITHIAGAIVAMLVGPFQFLGRVRARRTIHRWVGRAYLAGVLLGGLGGLYMSHVAYGGPSTRLAFLLLAVLWLATGFMAYRSIRARDIASHRRWMIRNFALTYAGAALRMYFLPLSLVFGELVGYMIVGWLCWVPNLLLAEAIVRGVFRRRRPQGPAQGAASTAAVGL